MLGIKEHWLMQKVPVIPHNYIISFRARPKNVWDVIVLFLAVWNAFFMPLQYAFEFKTSGFVSFFDLLVDLLFVVDIILMFLTSFLSKTGEEIKDSKKIAMHYITTVRFFTDFFSLLGLEAVGNLDHRLKIFGLLKILRVFRINIFIRRLNINSDVKAFLNICKYLLFVSMWLHFVGCFLWNTV